MKGSFHSAKERNIAAEIERLCSNGCPIQAARVFVTPAGWDHLKFVNVVPAVIRMGLLKDAEPKVADDGVIKF